MTVEDVLTLTIVLTIGAALLLLVEAVFRLIEWEDPDEGDCGFIDWRSRFPLDDEGEARDGGEAA